MDVDSSVTLVYGHVGENWSPPLLRSSSKVIDKHQHDRIIVY